MNIKAMVAGTTIIKRPASKLSRKLVKEGVMTICLGLYTSAELKGLAKKQQLINLYDIDNCHPWKEGIKVVRYSISWLGC